MTNNNLNVKELKFILDLECLPIDFFMLQLQHPYLKICDQLLASLWRLTVPLCPCTFLVCCNVIGPCKISNKKSLNSNPEVELSLVRSDLPGQFSVFSINFAVIGLHTKSVTSPQQVTPDSQTWIESSLSAEKKLLLFIAKLRSISTQFRWIWVLLAMHGVFFFTKFSKEVLLQIWDFPKDFP